MNEALPSFNAERDMFPMTKDQMNEAWTWLSLRAGRDVVPHYETLRQIIMFLTSSHDALCEAIGDETLTHNAALQRAADNKRLADAMRSMKTVAWLCDAGEGVCDATNRTDTRDDYARFGRSIHSLGIIPADIDQQRIKS